MWITVCEHPNYEVSDSGQVRNKTTKRLLKPRPSGRTTTKNPSRYVKVVLNGKESLVHRLVANAFIPVVEGKPHIDHINGVKNDNRVENLRWVSRSENIRNAQDGGLKTYESISRKVRATSLDNTDSTIFKSVTDCASFFNVCHQYISLCASGKRKLKGYRVCYVDE